MSLGAETEEKDFFSFRGDAHSLDEILWGNGIGDSRLPVATVKLAHLHC